MSKDKDSGEVLKFKDGGFDFLIKQHIVSLFEEGISHNIAGDLVKCFASFKALVFYIAPYEFRSKRDLLDLKDTLTDYFDACKGTPVRSSQVLLKNRAKIDLRVLMDEFMALVPQSYVELGIWLSTSSVFDDFDKQLSVENFGDEFSSLDSVREELLSFEFADLVSSLSANAVFEVFARLKFKDSISGKKVVDGDVV